MKRLFTAVAIVAVGAGCAHPFSRIQPGMTTAEVRAVTEEYAPTHVVPYASNAQAWYYGEDQCILIVDDRVTLKNVSSTETAVGLPGLGSLSVEKKAVCAPPGTQLPEQRDTHIFIPGVGGATLKN